MALVADAMDRPLAELKELNPAVLRSVAPAGTALHVPKGMVPMVQAAFEAVPANRRDAWRIHKVDGEETFVSLARRYNTTPALVSSVTTTRCPAGSLVVIPASYPGDRIPLRPAVRARAGSGTRPKGRPPADPCQARDPGAAPRATTSAKTSTKASAPKGVPARVSSR
jgi:hypothetical protein